MSVLFMVNYNVFTVNVSVVYGTLQCWPWSISILFMVMTMEFMVNVNVVHGK